MSGAEKIRDFKYVDYEKVNELFEQIEQPNLLERKVSNAWGISLAGPKVSSTTSTTNRIASSSEKISALIKYLDASDNLGSSRPLRMPQAFVRDGTEKQEIKKFILEKCTATKVVLPQDLVEPIRGVSEFAIWVSEPETDFLSEKRDEWDFCGTFLFLTHLKWERDEFRTVLSGCSALQAIANGASSLSALQSATNGYEPLGRGSYDHPTRKLQTLGATVSHSRQIEVLYRPQYMANEQCFMHKGQKVRVNDLMAYPLFIAEPI